MLPRFHLDDTSDYHPMDDSYMHSSPQNIHSSDDSVPSLVFWLPIVRQQTCRMLNTDSVVSSTRFVYKHYYTVYCILTKVCRVGHL